ncbi:protein of unknown function [Paraburkholderia kururiensis]
MHGEPCARAWGRFAGLTLSPEVWGGFECKNTFGSIRQLLALSGNLWEWYFGWHCWICGL